MKQITKRVTLLLLAVLLLALSAACTTTPGNSQDTTNSLSTSTDTETSHDNDFNDIIPDDLPDDLDFGGEKVTFLWWTDDVDGPFENEGDGEVVSEALYDRDMKVEERLKVDLDHIGKIYTWGTQNEYISSILTSAYAAEPLYDIVSGQYAIMPILIVEGVYLNLLQQEYLDFDKPWWINDVVENTSIAGKMYLATGSISERTVSQAHCLYLNQKLLNDYQLEDPTQIVLDGDWTFDKLIEMSTGKYRDLDEDQTKSVGDSFGLVFPDPNSYQGLEGAFEIYVTKNDSAGIPELVFGEGNVNEILTKIQETLTKPDFWQGVEGAFNTATFEEGRALFCEGTLGDAAHAYRDMEDKFLVLPLPKYSERQEEYHTKLGEANELFGIMSNCDNVDAVAATMECLASEGYRRVDPAFYEVALKIKFNKADQPAQIFDLIRNGITYDFGSLYGYSIQMQYQIKGYMTPAVNGNGETTSWSTYWSKYASSSQRRLAQFIADVMELDH